MELKIQLHGEEREPAQNEANDDGHQHAHNALLLGQLTYVGPWGVHHVADGLPDPQSPRNGAIGHGHDDDGEEVEHHVVEEGVDLAVRGDVGEVLHADEGDARRDAYVVLHDDHDEAEVESLDDDLR